MLRNIQNVFKENFIFFIYSSDYKLNIILFYIMYTGILTNTLVIYIH